MHLPKAMQSLVKLMNLSSSNDVMGRLVRAPMIPWCVLLLRCSGNGVCCVGDDVVEARFMWLSWRI